MIARTDWPTAVKRQRPDFRPAADTKHRSRRLANLKKLTARSIRDAPPRYFFIFFFFFGFMAMGYFLLSMMISVRQG
jgi:hypothetical protein